MAISYFISIINKISEEKKSLKSNGEYFNIFSVLDRTENEVKGHSAFIAYLLNPNADHGQGRRYLDLFLAMLYDETIKNNSTQFLQEYKNIEWHIKTEKCIYYPRLGRIDILISDHKERNIIIENKIYAPESGNQLNNYYDYSHNLNYKTLIIYLTPNGRPPDNIQNIPSENIISLSYSKHINNWMKLITPYLACSVAPVARQYMSTIKHLTSNRRDDLPMELSEYFDKNPK